MMGYQVKAGTGVHWIICLKHLQASSDRRGYIMLSCELLIPPPTYDGNQVATPGFLTTAITSKMFYTEV
jgi:hypothetical protein